MPLKVVGAGFARTGTDSMRRALDILGFGPCHHMREVMVEPVQKARWRAFAKGAAICWEDLFEGYASCIDLPSAHYWRELADAFPDAPVIMTWRDPETWWPSFEKLLSVAKDLPDDPDALSNTLIGPKVFGGQPMTRETCIAVLITYFEEVRATIPAQRLLVHKSADGWGPLCAHLRVPVPDAPYPHSNARDAVQDNLVRWRASGEAAAGND